MLQIKNIKKEYKTGELIQKALDDVSLNLRDNEFVAILGPSGSGKTTLLNIIGGLDRYDSGDLIINGTSTKEYKDRDWDTYRNHSIGFVFQSYNLIPHQTVLANVELALTIGGISAKERKQRAIKALEDVGLGEQIHKKPNQMSGGQMQRVALARALVNNPDILLADEPTGALDTETSIQVMNLLKDVANDRLVVMVTHNPELAEQYASRIVKLRDGKITDDSQPYTDEEAEKDIQQQKEQQSIDNIKNEKRKKLSGMSFFTSLSLSFNNLKTKKGRTILTSFAGSIGIIGIALILSMSTGVNEYIDQIQRDTMTSYPITISSQSFDMSALMGQNNESGEGDLPESEVEERDKDMVYANYADLIANNAVTTSIKENNLTDFKKYLDDPESEIHKYIGENGIVYTYNVNFKAYSYDPTDKLVDTDMDTTSEYTSENSIFGNMVEAGSLMMSNMSTLMGGSGTNTATNFSEMMGGANGDVVSQVIKDGYEVVYGSWPNDYDEVVLVLNRRNTLFTGTLYQLGYISGSQYKKAINDIKQENETDEIRFSYKELCEKEFYIIIPSECYEENENGTFSYIGDDEEKMEKVVENALTLRIVGIVKPTEEDSGQQIGSTIGYTTMLTDYIIQNGNSSKIVKAQEKTPNIDVLTGQEFEETELSNAEKAKKAKKYVSDLSTEEKAALFSAVMMMDYAGAMESLMANQMGDLGEQLGPYLSAVIMQATQEAILQAIASARQSLEEAVGKGEFPIDIPTLPETTSETQTAQEESSGEQVSEQESESEKESSTSEPSTEQETKNPNSNIDWEAYRKQLEGLDIESIIYSYDFGNALNINLDFGSAMDGIDFEMDEQDMADIVQNWLDNEATEEELVNIFDQYMGFSTYDDNMQKFGLISYDAPSSISLYTDSFEGKDGISMSIDNYNDGKEEEDKIVYTDVVSLLTTSITTIINAISYVLIGFVAVSLFVSCIMIGVITNISVLERTKEIGVLRALGASKANISQVFNAETFIIGCFSGLIGVGISLLAILPINMIVHSLMGNNNLSAQLPITSAAILILISIVITIIGGLIPSSKAAKKDPVIALRTE